MVDARLHTHTNMIDPDIDIDENSVYFHAIAHPPAGEIGDLRDFSKSDLAYISDNLQGTPIHDHHSGNDCGKIMESWVGVDSALHIIGAIDGHGFTSDLLKSNVVSGLYNGVSIKHRVAQAPVGGKDGNGVVWPVGKPIDIALCPLFAAGRGEDCRVFEVARGSEIIKNATADGNELPKDVANLCGIIRNLKVQQKNQKVETTNGIIKKDCQASSLTGGDKKSSQTKNTQEIQFEEMSDPMQQTKEPAQPQSQVTPPAPAATTTQQQQQQQKPDKMDVDQQQHTAPKMNDLELIAKQNKKIEELLEELNKLKAVQSKPEAQTPQSQQKDGANKRAAQDSPAKASEAQPPPSKKTDNTDRTIKTFKLFEQMKGLPDELGDYVEKIRQDFGAEKSADITSLLSALSAYKSESSYDAQKNVIDKYLSAQTHVDDGTVEFVQAACLVNMKQAAALKSVERQLTDKAKAYEALSESVRERAKKQFETLRTLKESGISSRVAPVQQITKTTTTMTSNEERLIGTKRRAEDDLEDNCPPKNTKTEDERNLPFRPNFESSLTPSKSGLSDIWNDLIFGKQ